MKISLQENILILAVYDQEILPVLISNVPSNLFSNQVYKTIITHCYDYYLQYKKPAQEHLPDLLDPILNGNDKKKAKEYAETISFIYTAYESINKKFVLKELETFIKDRNFVNSLKKAHDHYTGGDLDKAIDVMQKKRRLFKVFESGTKLNELNKIFIQSKGDIIKLGIKTLDKYNINPAKGELFTYLAPGNTGKSWFLIHAGKEAYKQKKKVLHITLEMSEEKVAKRYLQAFYAISNRDEKVKISKFRKEGKSFTEIINKVVSPPLVFDSKTFMDDIHKKIKRFDNRRLIIKRFSTGSLTMNKLIAYIENLITFEKFVPDMVLLDYPDLMKIDGNNKKNSTSEIYIALRGLAIDYNFALVCVSQVNRGGYDIKWIGATQIAEDISKYDISDNLISYNQTPKEFDHKIARVFVCKARNDLKNIKVLISQNYFMGQYCLDSINFSKDYHDLGFMKRGK